MLQTGDNYRQAVDESVHNGIQGCKDHKDLEMQMSATECWKS